MATVSDRIKQSPVCEFIDLFEQEKNIYSGSGWKLARFENEKLAGFFDPMNVEWNSDVQAMADEALKAATAWLANAQGETWLVMCSCYQLCEPRRVSLRDPMSLAHMVRVFADQFMDDQ
jgi:hypothetical protein